MTARMMVVAAMRYRARYTTRYAMPSWYDDPALLSEEVVTLRPRREEWV
jgi:hypothetical protein